MLNTVNNIKMNEMKQESAKIIPLYDGVWMEPAKACRYFKHGKGITYKTLMNKIYSGKMRNWVKYTPQGWLVFVSFEAIRNIAA